MNKGQEKPPEADIDIEILVNAVMAAKSAANAAEAALRSFLRKRAGVSSGGTPERKVPATFMARATRMVHEPTDTPEGDQNVGQAASEGSGGDGGGVRHQWESSDGGQDTSRGDDTNSQNTERSHIQQG